MYLEEKIDNLLELSEELINMIRLFLPNLETEKGVIHFLEITRNTFNSYMNQGVFVEGKHYVKNGKQKIFIPDEIVKLKQEGVKGMRKKQTKQEMTEEVKSRIGIISTGRGAVCRSKA